MFGGLFRFSRILFFCRQPKPPPRGLNSVPNENVSDYALTLAAQVGDLNALSRLVERVRAPLFTLAYAQTGNYDDAQDAVASGLLRACHGISKLQKPDSFRPWLFQIVRNEARRIREKRLLSAPEDEIVSDVSRLSESGGVIFRVDVQNALRALPRDHARALSLHYLDNLPVSDIAARLSRPEGTVKYWLHRGRAALAHELKGYNPMKPAETPLPALTAAIIATDLAPELLAQMQTSLARAGWSDVQTRIDFADLGKRPLEGSENQEPHPLWKNKLLVLDEWINGRSVFEYIPLLRGRKNTKDTALFVLMNGGRSEEETNITVCAAYVSGVDMLLTKPFDIAEFENFARRIFDDMRKNENASA